MSDSSRSPSRDRKIRREHESYRDAPYRRDEHRISRPMVSSQNDNDDTIQKMKRGPTRMKGLTRLRDKGIRFEADYNSEGRFIGDASTTLASGIEVVVRQKVPIDIRGWRQVTKQMKEMVWIEIKSLYVIDEGHKDDILVAAGNQWKQFKNYLTEKYVRKGLIEVPPNDYPWIEQQVWNNFVHYCTSAEFQITQSSSESSEEVSTTDRSELWRIDRKKSDGSYITDDARDIVEKIDFLSQSASHGQIQPYGMNAKLTMTIGTQEHSDRVRSIGHGSSIKKNFKTSRRHQLTDFIEAEVERCVKAEMEKMKAQMREEMAVMLEEMSKMYRSHQPLVYGGEVGQSPPQSASDSCTISHHLSSMSMGSTMMCELAIEDMYGQIIIVALATVFAGDDSSVLHGILLGKDNVKVSITTSIVADAPLPFPLHDVEISTVVNAVGSYVAWPRRLVVLGHTSIRDKGKKVTQYPAKGSLPTKGSIVDTKTMRKKEMSYLRIMVFYTKIMTNENIISIPMEISIFGEESSLSLDKYEISQFVQLTEIGASSISVWMRHFFYKYSDAKYGFLDPSRIAYIRNMDQDERVQYIARAMLLYHDHRLFFAPYNAGEHWILCVIDPQNAKVYWLDPLRHDVRDDIKQVINMTITIFCSQRGISNTSSKAKWINIQCPKQSDSVLCGYHVMRFMQDIITNQYYPSIPVKFTFASSHTRQQIDDLREEWAESVYTIVSSNQT